VTARRLRAATVVLAAAGAGIAAYLSYSRLADTSLICPTSGCATVQRSSYATVAGVPVAYLGVGGYLAIAAAAIAGRRLLMALLIVVAAGFGTYLLVAQLAFVHAVCMWCLGSDAVVYSLLLVAGIGVQRRLPWSPHAPVPRHDVRLPDERARQRAHQGDARGARAG
jgi:uncharacterized membrane protein